jgi:lamin tail-like protein
LPERAARHPLGSGTIQTMRAPLLVAGTIGCCLLGATGCEKLLSIQDPVAGNGPGHDGGIDSSDGGGPPPGSPLLLSEVVLTPDPGEMIEIFNTSSSDVQLSTYYLSDSGNYYRLPAGATIDPTDFLVKFPEGAVIHGQQALTVAIALPADFLTTYSILPSFSLRDGSMQTLAMNGAPQLTNGGEPIILFQWDGRSDLVSDVDILLAGAPGGATNALPNKSNATQDGPDADTIAGKYAVDLGTIHAQPAAPGSGVSTKRIALEDGHEMHNGTGNGPSGDDETSEDTAATWDGTTTSPFTAPTPGKVPSQLMR